MTWTLAPADVAATRCAVWGEGGPWLWDLAWQGSLDGWCWLGASYCAARVAPAVLW